MLFPFRHHQARVLLSSCSSQDRSSSSHERSCRLGLACVVLSSWRQLFLLDLLLLLPDVDGWSRELEHGNGVATGWVENHRGLFPETVGGLGASDLGEQPLGDGAALDHPFRVVAELRLPLG